MTTHCISAAKGNKTIHDKAELTLQTIKSYIEHCPLVPPSLIKFNYKGDAANIHLFLTEHLPDETLIELKLLLFPKYLHAAVKKKKI